MKASFNLFGADGKHCHQTGEQLNLKCAKKSVKGRGGSVMVWGVFSAAGVGPILQLPDRVNAEPSSTTCGSFPAFTQSASNFHAQQCPLSHSKMGKAVPWSWKCWKHWNNEMASPESWSKSNRKPLENHWWQSYGQETHYSHQTVEDTGRRVEEITPEQCERLVMSCGHRCAEVCPSEILVVIFLCATVTAVL